MLFYNILLSEGMPPTNIFIGIQKDLTNIFIGIQIDGISFMSHVSSGKRVVASVAKLLEYLNVKIKPDIW